MKLSIVQDDGQSVRVAVAGQITQREVSPLDEPLQALLGPGAYGRAVRLEGGFHEVPTAVLAPALAAFYRGEPAG